MGRIINRHRVIRVGIACEAGVESVTNENEGVACSCASCCVAEEYGGIDGLLGVVEEWGRGELGSLRGRGAEVDRLRVDCRMRNSVLQGCGE